MKEGWASISEERRSCPGMSLGSLAASGRGGGEMEGGKAGRLRKEGGGVGGGGFFSKRAGGARAFNASRKCGKVNILRNKGSRWK